jgi:hypothetical protein
VFAAKGNRGELLSGSVASHTGLAGSYSCAFGAGMLTGVQAGCAGSYSSCLEAESGGLEGSSWSEERWIANGDELSPSGISVDGRDR